MGSSTYGKGDTSRSGLRGDAKGGGYQMSGQSPRSNLAAKGRNLAGYTSIAPAPEVATGKVAVEKPSRRYAEPIGPMKPKSVPRTYVPTPFKPKPPVAIKPPAKKPPAAAKPTTRGPAAPTRTAQPSRMAVNPRTGNTTGFTTGTRTGISASKPGVAGKTTQSAYSRQMSNAARNQPAGPMGGGGRGGSMGSSGSSSRTSSGGNLGGARGRISEPGGSKR